MPWTRGHARWGVCLVLAVAGPAYAEISVMTKERFAEAAELGRTAATDTSIVYAGTCRTRGKAGTHLFEVRVMTPFAAVALAVFESIGRGAPPDPGHWPVDAPRDQSVIVSVDPAALRIPGVPPAPPLDVEKVMLRRADQTTEARRADTHDVVFPDTGEKPLKRRGGAWYFPLEPFASERGDLEIVVIPKTDVPGASAVLKLEKRLLAKLR